MHRTTQNTDTETITIPIDTVIMMTTDIMVTDMDLMGANDTVTDMSIMEEISRALQVQDIGVAISERGFLL